MKAILQHTKNRERVPWTVSLPGPSLKWLPASKDVAMGAFGTVVSSRETNFWGKLLRRGQPAPPRPLHRNSSHASWAAGGW